MIMEPIEQKVKQIFLNLGADVCGIAGIDRFANAPAGFHPSDIYKECRSVIVFAKRMPRGLASVNPRIVYNHANDLNILEVDRIAYQASGALEESGCVAIPLPCDSPYDYWEEDTLHGKGILSMRHAAALAGLGSFGKNTLLINRKYGNFISIGCVLTNLDLASDPLEEELCLKNCRLCMDNCPACALNGQTVDQKLCRTYTYSTNGRGFSIVNCNICRTVCPMSLGVKDL